MKLLKQSVKIIKDDPEVVYLKMTGFESQWKKLFNKTFNNPQTNELLKLISTKILI